MNRNLCVVPSHQRYFSNEMQYKRTCSFERSTVYYRRKIKLQKSLQWKLQKSCRPRASTGDRENKRIQWEFLESPIEGLISITEFISRNIAFKERWFRLIKNYLFYFKISEMGKFDTKNPAGVFVMENSSIQMEHGQSISFSFSISFIDEPEKRHVFAARCEDNVVQWVMKLRQCTYEYLRNQLHTLQSKIYSITSKDPLLMVPRNDGACLWAPSVPFSTTAACTVNTSSFVCHLHTNGAFTLERSKSDAQAYQHLRGEQKSNTSFYVENNTSDEAKEVKNYSLEKSQTSALFNTSLNTVSMSIFDNRPQYSRAAPSPPVRNKLSPRFRRGGVSEDHKVFTDQGKFLGQESILGVVPIPPRRKVSPKHQNVGKESNGPESTKDEEVETQTEDLIKF